jgi:ADP-heptose:LPS heptosyltransferase
MHTQLVPPELLAKADKILFVTHLAIGDFTYMQNYFQAFAKQYPHIKIHLWVDEVRRTRLPWRWKQLKEYALYDWLETSPFFQKIYKNTYSPSALKQSIKDACNQNYPIVISLSMLRPHCYARLARSLSPQGFVVGLRFKIRFYNLMRMLAYRKLNAFLSPVQLEKGMHITHVYAQWFYQLFGITVTDKDQFPFIKIPNKWIVFAKLRFLKWGIDKRTKRFGHVVFINPFAKTPKRSWSLEQVAELICKIKQLDSLGDVSFVVNVVPEEYKRAHKFFEKRSLTNTYLFTADYNFFQLPAVVGISDIVVSVETSVMHLANATKVPVVALMRTKNPEWVPFDQSNSIVVTTRDRKEWVKNITPDQVIEALGTVPRILQKSHQV